ncbi:MAG: hypothetical protein ABI131_01195 [Nostocoides sp.]
MPIEIRELEILAEPQSAVRDAGDAAAGRSPQPGPRQIERSLLAWHHAMLLRADRLRAD